MHAFFKGRIAVLGLGFAVLPLALALAPGVVNAAVPVILAGVLSATLGLIGLRYGSARLAVCAVATGVATLAFAPWLGGLAGATAGIAAFALAIELAALPAAHRRTPEVPAVLMLVAILVGCVGIVTAGAAAPSVQAAVAALLLPLAPVLTLIDTQRASHRALADHRTSAETRTRRDASLVAAADVAVLVIDRGAQVLDMTEAATRLLGCGHAVLAGRGLVDRVLIAERPALLKAVSDAAVAGIETRLTVHVAEAGDGRGAPRFSAYAVLVRPAAEGAGEATIRLEPAAAAAPPAECRAALFAALSHEVRTPMNAILGFSEILANPALQPKTPAEVAEYAAIIHKSALGAFAVTRAVVDLLRVESADFRVEPEALDIAEFAAKLVAGLAEKSECRFEATPGAFEAETDARCLRMALTNIIEGFAGAGLSAPVVVRLARRGGQAVLSITCAAEAPRGRLAHAAYLGVVEALTHRIAALAGYEITLSVTEAALSASVAVPVAASLAVLPERTSAGTVADPIPMLAFRKIA